MRDGEIKATDPGVRRRGLIAAGLAGVGAVFVAAAVLVWFTGGHRWELGPLTVTLNDWTKPLTIGAGWWLARCLVAAGPPLPLVWARRLVWRLEGRAGLSFDRLGRGGHGSGVGFFSVALGGAAGTLFVWQYRHLVPWWSLWPVVVIGAAALSWALHWVWWTGAERALGRLIKDAGRRRSAIIGFYLAGWAALVVWPLRRWEARLCEPIWLELLVALIVGLALALAAALPRRWPVGVVLTMLAGLVAHDVIAARGVTAPRDRVILITLDTVRADHLGCQGYPRPTTPVLDRLAASGARFARAYCPMGVTDPSHASMLLGVYPRAHGIKAPMARRRSGYSASLADYFRDRGYRTAAITSRIALDPVRLGAGGFETTSSPKWEESRAPEAYRRALNWLTDHRGEDAFLWVHFFDPHQPFEPHPEVPVRFVEDGEGAKSGDKWLKGSKRYEPAAVKARVDRYDEEIEYTDLWIGRLLAAVDRLEPKSLRPTCVIVIADHGEALGELQDEPYRFGFGHGGVLREGVAHIPFIVSWPGRVPAGLAPEDPVEVVDLAPTLARLVLGVDFPSQGHDLSPYFQGQSPTPRPTAPAPGLAFLERDLEATPPRAFLGTEQFVVIKWPFKLFAPSGAAPELFDLSADPAELTNLAPLRPDIVSDLLAELQTWQALIPPARLDDSLIAPGELRWLEALGYINK